MAERRLHGLQRVLGTNALFSTAYGNVGSSIYYALGLVAGLALGLTPLVFLITGFFFFCTAATYAEATAMYPEAGGSSSFARRAFNEAVSFLAGWAQLLNYVITVAISAFFVPHYLGGLVWEPLRSSPADIVFGIGVVAVLVAVNVRGVRESAALNVLLAVVDLFTQILLVAAGIVLVLSPEVLLDGIDLGVAPTWRDFLLAIPLGMIAYTGIETISHMAEEARDEATTIPRAITRVQVAVFAIYFTLPAVALSALPVQRDPQTGESFTLLGLSEEEGGFAGDPIRGVVEAIDLGFLNAAAEVYIALLAATILLVATNAGLIGVSRLVYSMGMYRQLPDGLRRLHPRHGTPWIGILVFGAAACLAILPGEAEFLGNIYAFGAMLSFTIAHIALVALRWRFPDVARPYTAPLSLPWRGRSIPVLAVVGGAGTGTAFVVVTVLNPEIAAVGALWLAVGAAVYALYRRGQGLGLVSTTRIVLPAPVVDHEAAYESVLVALDLGQDPTGAVAMAKKVSASRPRGIHVLVTITVPASSPLESELPEKELAAQALVERAKLLGGRRVTGHTMKVRAGQAGRAIVDEAREIGAKAIVMSLPDRGPAATGATVFGKTLETVLGERPCRVIIHAGPGRDRRHPVRPGPPR